MNAEPGLRFTTFTMIGRCEREGLLGTAITSSPLCVAARCQFVKANLAAVATQAYTDPATGHLALNLLELGYSPEKVLEELKATDEWSEYRQIGIVDHSGRSAVFTGSKNGDWKGHLNGPNYVAMGNGLAGPICENMVRAFNDAGDEILEERLVRALEAGRDAGGCTNGQLSAGLLVFGRNSYSRTDLRVDMYPSQAGQSGDAVDELRRIFNEFKTLIRYYELRPRNPQMESWREWQKKHRR